MRATVLPGTDLRVSRFAFGTGSLIGAGRQGSRLRLLHLAVDAGFTHFDTAPYYGFGIAESDLANVLARHRDVTFTTKVGLHSPGGECQSSLAVWIRKALGRCHVAVSRPIVDFSVAAARRSLEGSLRRTGRDRVDFYALHDPTLALVDCHEWRTWLDDCVAKGTVRYFGMASTAERLGPFFENESIFGSVMQVRDSLDGREADFLEHYGRPMQFTYGYVSSAIRRTPARPVAEVLRMALDRNRHGAVVVSSMKTDRLKQYAAIAEETFDDR